MSKQKKEGSGKKRTVFRSAAWKAIRTADIQALKERNVIRCNGVKNRAGAERFLLRMRARRDKGRTPYGGPSGLLMRTADVARSTVDQGLYHEAVGLESRRVISRAMLSRLASGVDKRDRLLRRLGGAVKGRGGLG